MINTRLSRRHFMAGAVAASAAGLSTSRLLGAKAAPANSRIGIGMIGMGRQARYANLPPFLNSPDTQVVAVCEADQWRMDEAKGLVEKFYAGESGSGSYKGCAVHKDFRELLARPDVDAVMISTPDHWHVPMALAAARAGKDIALEKPITRCIAEGRLLADTVKRYGRVFRTDSEIRSTGIFHRLVELVRNGRIGKVKRIETGVPRGDVAGGIEKPEAIPKELDWKWWLGPAPQAPYCMDRAHPRGNYGRPGWMRCLDYCDGMITNWGTHLNDIAQWANNSEETGPVEIEGSGMYPTEGLWNVCIDFLCKYKYANGVELVYKIDHPYVRVEGTEGWINAVWFKNTFEAEPKSILRSPIGENEIRFPLKTEKQDFIDCIKTRSRTLADAEVGHRTTSICHLGHIAIRLGRKLTWNPQTERFANDDMANAMLTRPMREPWTI